MKEIIIYQEKNQPVHLHDEDDSNISEYAKNISSILEASNVTILEVTSGCLIVRPHKINSIEIYERILKEDKPQIEVEHHQEASEVENLSEDIIMDGD